MDAPTFPESQRGINRRLFVDCSRPFLRPIRAMCRKYEQREKGEKKMILSTMELSARLAVFDKCTFIGLHTVTIPKLLKKSRRTKEPCPYGHIEKHSRVTGQIGGDYETAVNNRLDKLGETPDFEAQGRSWGSHVGDSPIVSHNGKFYLHYRALQHHSSKFFDENGNEVPRSDLVDYLPLDNDEIVTVRSVLVNNIRSIRIEGNEFTISDIRPSQSIVA